MRKVQRNWKPLAAGATGGGVATFGGMAAVGANRKRREGVGKRFDSEGNRHKRLDRYSAAADLTGVGLAGATGYTGVRAAQLKSPKLAGVAGAAGLASIGSHLSAKRIQSYKKGKGASYRPLARRKAE